MYYNIDENSTHIYLQFHYVKYGALVALLPTMKGDWRSIPGGGKFLIIEVYEIFKLTIN